MFFKRKNSRACPACAGAEMLPLRPKDETDLIICARCRHVTWQRMPTDEELQRFYSTTYTESHNQPEVQAANMAYYADHARELAAIVKKPLTNIAIADIGCSIPTFLEQAVKQGCPWTIGVDWSPEARKYGERVGVSVITPDKFRDTIPDGTLDVLRYSHTLEHLVDPAEVVRTQIRKLRRGGLLYITQPNFPVLHAEKTPEIDLLDSKWPNHLHFFNPISAMRMLDRLGAKPIKFFSVSNEMGAEERYRPFIDVVYAAKNLMGIAKIGEPNRGPLNGFPYYTGENSGIYAIY